MIAVSLKNALIERSVLFPIDHGKRNFELLFDYFSTQASKPVRGDLPRTDQRCIHLFLKFYSLAFSTLWSFISKWFE